MKCRLVAQRIVRRIAAPLLSNLWRRLRRGATGHAQAQFAADAWRQQRTLLLSCSSCSTAAAAAATAANAAPDGRCAAVLGAANAYANTREFANDAAAAVQRIVAVVGVVANVAAVVVIVVARRLAAAAVPGRVAWRCMMPAAWHIQAVGSMTGHAPMGGSNTSTSSSTDATTSATA